MKQNVSESLQTIPKKNSINGDQLSQRIPIDLVFEILSRLPVKSIAKCRCVSKRWASILVRTDFTELFLTMFSARPQLLFFCQNRDDNDVSFFTSPQPVDEKNKDSLVASFRMKIPLPDTSIAKYYHIGGFVFLRYIQDYEGINKMVCPPVLKTLCNPSTGQSLVLPKKLKLKKVRRFVTISYVGYDPIEKQFKVLSISLAVSGGPVSQEHKVLTLGRTSKPSSSWRSIECNIPYNPRRSVICINGVIYYLAINRSSKDNMIVCFDVRSETFRFVRVKNSMSIVRHRKMIDYNGKLGFVQPGAEWNHGFTRDSTSIEVCVLQDAEKQEWSERTYALPALWKNVVAKEYLYFVGVSRRNEFVFARGFASVSKPFYIYYCDMERNTIVRVEIQGMERCAGNQIFTVLDHVESVKLLRT